MLNRWIFKIYNGLVLVALPLVVLGVALRWRRRFFSKGFQRWSERWGHLAPEQRALFGDGGWWWVHAVSVGEVKAIEPFLKRAPAQAHVKVLLSVVTPEALAWAQEKKIADQIIAAPIDLPWVVRRVFRAVKPQLFVSVESEFWPNLLREARRSGARVALINGRLSEHSFRSYRRVRFILRALWECIDLCAVRQSEDASRFAALGVPESKIRVTGNLKYDLPLPERNGGASHASLGPVLVLGSTREGEEARLLPVIEKIGRQYPTLQVIWAPRHVERVSEIETLLASSGFRSSRKSERKGGEHVLWDSMGDLLDAYKTADVAIVGGSFVPKGGQNPIEPAALRLPVVFGPSMENFRGISETLIQNGGACQVTLGDLEACLQDLLEHPDKRRAMGERARQTIESRQGATDRTLKLLEELCR